MTFASDNWAGACEPVLAALLAAGAAARARARRAGP